MTKNDVIPLQHRNCALRNPLPSWLVSPSHHPTAKLLSYSLRVEGPLHRLNLVAIQAIARWC